MGRSPSLSVIIESLVTSDSQLPLVGFLVIYFADSGQLPIALNEAPYTLDFMLHPDNTQKIIDTAYRYTRHEPGSDVVLFGTSNPDHVASNIKSILSPKLPKEQLDAIRDLFGKLEGVGLDEPNLTPTTKTVSS